MSDTPNKALLNGWRDTLEHFAKVGRSKTTEGDRSQHHVTCRLAIPVVRCMRYDDVRIAAAAAATAWPSREMKFFRFEAVHTLDTANSFSFSDSASETMS